MGLNDNDIESLTYLGLTDRQAKVYLSLVIAGPATVKVISKVSTVPRQETYRVITDLYKKGFIEKLLTNPVSFKATPLQQAVDILFKNKEAEIDRTLQKTSELLEKFKNKAQESFEEQTVSIISGLTKIQIDSIEYIKKDRICVDLAGPSKVFMSWLFSNIDILSQEANSKGVKYRVIIDKPKNIQLFEKTLILLRTLPNFTVKFSGNKAPLLFSIHDKKEIMLSLLPPSDQSGRSSMHTGNPVLVEVIQTYFDKLWEELEKKEQTNNLQKQMTPAKRASIRSVK